jgi:CheY-like chemotaxis protein
MPPSEKKQVDVLIVDDNESVLELVSELIQAKGYSFDIAKTGREAYGKVMTHAYSLILMDLKMPDWDGLYAIRGMEFCNAYEKVIVISAHLDDETIEELKKEPNVVDWLSKPFESQQLLERLEKYIPKS